MTKRQDDAPADAVPSQLTTFHGAESGVWKITRVKTVSGAPLPAASHVLVSADATTQPHRVAWSLRGAASHVRYVERHEKEALDARPSPLGRPEASRAALIPISKSPAWWRLAQDERRKIFESSSGHISQSLPYLPDVARQLYHCRDLGEPFDFLTWFEFAPEHEARFDELLARLRRTEEWTFVKREIDIRLTRAR